ncbi:ATP synthase subunit I [Orrella sp. 11846]|uniref:N-ATPase subunit AtpR n=1 Tax=Orrella sp. 11846 TaxID=3409913 RepID=UPI003B5D0290
MNVSMSESFQLASMMPALIVGLLVGLIASFVFFKGLAFGMQKALQSSRPAPILLISFLIRTLVLLGLGWGLIQVFQPAWALLGYAIAFFIVRFVMVRRAKHVATQRI